jgi:hypothetical protein
VSAEAPAHRADARLGLVERALYGPLVTVQGSLTAAAQA